MKTQNYLATLQQLYLLSSSAQTRLSSEALTDKKYRKTIFDDSFQKFKEDILFFHGADSYYLDTTYPLVFNLLILETSFSKEEKQYSDQLESFSKMKFGIERKKAQMISVKSNFLSWLRERPEIAQHLKLLPTNLNSLLSIRVTPFILEEILRQQLELETPHIEKFSFDKSHDLVASGLDAWKLLQKKLGRNLSDHEIEQVLIRMRTKVN